MRRLMLVVCTLLMSGCVSTKPFFFAADHQEKMIERTMIVLYDDFPESDVTATVNGAVTAFYKNTNIKVNILEYRRMKWESCNMDNMIVQALQSYPHQAIPSAWVLMIYRKTPLEWALLFIVGNVEGAAEAGGRWAFVNRLSKSLIMHELYHLGWKIEQDEESKK